MVDLKKETPFVPACLRCLSVEEILNLSTTWPVILVPDPDGMPPDYLAPINSLTRDLVNHAHDLQLIGWGKTQLYLPSEITTHH